MVKLLFEIRTNELSDRKLKFKRGHRNKARKKKIEMKKIDCHNKSV